MSGKMRKCSKTRPSGSAPDDTPLRRIALQRGAIVALTAFAFAPVVQPASAATSTWAGAGTDANWMTTANWTGSSIAVSNNLQFAGSTQLSNTNNFTAGSSFPTVTFNSGAGSFILSGNSITLSASSATGLVNSSTSLQTIDLPVTLSGGRTIDAAAGPISIADGLAGTSGAIYGVNPSLTTPGPTALSTVTINSAATYSTSSTSTAGTIVDSGTLQIGAGGSLPTSTANATGWVQLGNSTSNTSGVLELGDASTPINQTINKLTNFGTGTANAVVGGNATNSLLTINYVVTTSNDSFNGSLGGSGTNQNNLSLLKTGAGLLSLGGVNTYLGTTEVSGGTLVNNGDLTTSAVTVDPGAELAGNSSSTSTGTFGAVVQVGGLIAPGSSGAATGATGSLSFLSDLDFTGVSAAYDCDLKNAGSASDVLDVAGNLSLGASTTLNLNTIDSTSGSTYTIATYTGILTGTFATITGLPAGYSINYGTGTDSSITLVVPEPAGATALGGVLALLSVKRRARTRLPYSQRAARS